jgi:hypothetical protein
MKKTPKKLNINPHGIPQTSTQDTETNPVPEEFKYEDPSLTLQNKSTTRTLLKFGVYGDTQCFNVQRQDHGHKRVMSTLRLTTTVVRNRRKCYRESLVIVGSQATVHANPILSYIRLKSQTLPAKYAVNSDTWRVEGICGENPK